MEGKAKVISQCIEKHVDSLVASYTIEGATRTIVDAEKFHKEVKRPVRRGNRFVEAHSTGRSHAREVAKRGQLQNMYHSIPILSKKIEKEKDEAAVVKKEKKKSRFYERYRELWRKDPEAYAARMSQLIKEIDDLETGKAGKPLSKEGSKEPQK